MRRIGPVVLILACLCTPVFPALAVEKPADVPIDRIDWGQVPEYRIVPGDVLSLDFGPGTVQRDIREAPVRPDGRITLFPVGDVVAAGRTPVELQTELIRLLSAEFRQPRVTVAVKTMAGNRIHVLGRVKRPGSTEATSLPTLLQVISEAGGFEDDAARNSVLVLHRAGLGTVRVDRVRVERLMRSGGDVPLGRFDIVYVPRSSIGNLNLFVEQFFGRVAVPLGSAAFLGWELFHLDKVFVTTTVR